MSAAPRSPEEHPRTCHMGPISQPSFRAVLLLVLATTATAQNDECTGALALANGASVGFDTSGASFSATPWSCTASVAPDLWYRYTAVSSGVSLDVQTCGSSFDTALAVFDGVCGALQPLGCSDDGCGPQSEVLVPNLVAGRAYFIRVGGANAAFGSGTLVAREVSLPAQACVSNPGFEAGVNRWMLADIAAPLINAAATTSGSSPGFGLFACAPTEGSYALTHGFDGAGPGRITLAQDLTVATGSTSLVFDYRAGWDMLGFTGSTQDRTFDVVVRHHVTGAALQSTRFLTASAGTRNLDSGPRTGGVDLALFLGQAVRVSFEWTIPEAFTGPGHFQLDNIGCAASGAGVGANYCFGNPNSTGAVGSLFGTGSASVAANDLTLVAGDLPPSSFGHFLTSEVQAIVPTPGGSQGVLCLGSAIGRYVGPGQIQSSGSLGTFSLRLDLAQTPTPTGFVSVAAGQTRNFQAWHRDAVGGAATSNFTVGLAVTFL